MLSFDDKYEIRFANKSDIPDIMKFIDGEWKEGHILGKDIDFFHYEHVIEDKVTFLIALDKENNSIEGLLGYILASNEKNSDIWTGIWKVKKQARAFLGMELMKRLPEMTCARTLIGLGDNPDTTIKLFKLMKKNHSIVLLKQYYRLNENVNNYKLINKFRDTSQCGQYYNDSFDDIIISRMDNINDIYHSIDLEKYRNCVPYKDYWYIKHRYLDHPIFDYSIYFIRGKGNNTRDDGALLIMRNDKFEDRIAIRIVDYIGNQALFSHTYKFWNVFFSNKNIEYVDMYEYGFEEDYLRQAGFIERIDSDCVIPNYYHPFEKRNVDIWCDSSNANTLFFKGDGDQDRPN